MVFDWSVSRYNAVPTLPANLERQMTSFDRVRQAVCVQVAIVAATVIVAIECSGQQPPSNQRRPTKPTAAAFDVLLRGPIHEGFAQPAVLDAAEPLLVSKRPPPALREFPPAIRPAANQTVWLPGYWGWDEGQENFLWVSGVWRVPPPGMRWVPGYWSARDDHFAWTPGFWFAKEAARLQYSNSPPALQKAERVQPAAAPDQFYVPGYWAAAGDKNVWRRGHWATFQEGWVWMPTRYATTPAGSVLVRGYWDYPLARRGVLFAPVSQAKAEQPGTFTPEVTLDAHRLGELLFTWTAYGHYCFGDYFGDTAGAQKIRPWFAVPNDPLFAYENWERSRVRPGWHESLVNRFGRLQTNAELRPSRRLGDATTPNALLGRELAMPLDRLFRSSDSPLPLTVLSYEARSNAAQAAGSVALLAAARAKFEVAALDEAAPGRPRALALPAPVVQAPAKGDAPRVGTTGEYIPGVQSREVPGFGRRTLPGMAGRNLPGVDTTAPGVVGPGVSPGADTRTLPGAELTKPQVPQRP